MGCLRMWGFDQRTYQFKFRCWLPGEEHQAEKTGAAVAYEFVLEAPEYFTAAPYGISLEIINRVKAWSTEGN